VVTGATGQIGSSLIFMIGKGCMFGPDQKVILQLHSRTEVALKGLMLELKDCAFPLIADMIATTDPEAAFKDADVAVLVGAKPRGPGMERSDLLKENAEIFKAQGEAIDRFANKNIKVLVVGNPANTNALIASHYAPSIPKKNFTALTRLDQNRALSLLAEKTGSRVEAIKNVVIWGNHSATQYPDISDGSIALEDGSTKPLREAIGDDRWIEGEFISRVQNRGAEIISATGRSSVASAANAICDHMHDWWVGTKPGEWASMAVITEGGPYGIAEDLIFSMPVTAKNGEWHVVSGLSPREFSQRKLKATEQELLGERKLGLGI